MAVNEPIPRAQPKGEVCLFIIYTHMNSSRYDGISLPFLGS